MSTTWPPPMMACGCTAMSVHKNDHDGLGEDHPSCIAHDCCEVVQGPDLTGRTARCDEYGRAPRKNECDNCRGKEVCSCEKPSSLSLAFFVYRGPGSHWAEDFCKCGHINGSHPSLGGTGRYKENNYTIAKGIKPDLIPTLCENKGGSYEKRGPSEYDRYYCGCHSWD
jgi:hypothetical protein